MILTGNEDLRIKRTIESINEAFKKLLCETDYEKISVTKLCQEARISKKTFYFYYSDLDELLKEMMMQYSSAYAKSVARYHLPEDAKDVIKEFFVFSSHQGEAYDRITYLESFRYIRNQMIHDVRAETKIESFSNTLPGIYMSTALLEIYIYWVNCGKKESLDEIIKEATNLILNVLNGMKS